MTDLPLPPDDEIVSAVLDGEATDDERARVEGDPDLSRRLAELRGVSAAVAEPVVPLDELTAHRLVDRAIDDAGAGALPVPGAGRPALSRSSPRWWQGRLGVGIGSAAIVVLLALVVVPALLSGGGDDGDDFATADIETADGGEEAEAADESEALADDGARSIPDAAQGSAPPPDAGGDDADLGARQWLGSFDTLDELATALEQERNDTEADAPAPATTTSTATSAFAAGDALAELVPECPDGPGGAWPAELQPPFEAFDALVDGTPVVVVTGSDTSGERVVTGVERSTCAPVELP